MWQINIYDHGRLPVSRPIAANCGAIIKKLLFNYCKKSRFICVRLARKVKEARKGSPPRNRNYVCRNLRSTAGSFASYDYESESSRFDRRLSARLERNKTRSLKPGGSQVERRYF
ncbi:hypothetical protein PUN28_012038 [Cardiocondyla obscurior]|uniref:Uncharacterized protein n=1 Tax=Cardiocondyla obscurior TaxID=286306 RepID=A0AAW2FAA2_9HYME